MKKNSILILSISILTAYIFFLLPGCSKDGSKTQTQKYTYTLYSPVYKNRADVIAGINSNPTTPIEHAGKLYIKDNFIYVNEVNKGIHIINNSNPSKPLQVAFLSIPGNLDIAVKGNILYADMYDELLALDITDPHHAKLTNSIKNFFTERAYIGNYPANTDDKVAIDWNEKDTTIEFTTTSYPPNCDACVFETMNNGANVPTAKSSGTAGSMASMVLMNNYLYAISERHSLGIVDVSNATNPKLDSSFFAGYDLETIYPFEDKLFLGSQIGVFMYDVSDPKHPVSAGQFEHGTACDPVIADANYAYVTLHSGTYCGGDANELDVVDITNISNSKLVKSYALQSPKGLSKDGSLLFVCDSTNVKVFNAATPSALTLMQSIASKSPYDVISGNKKLIVVNADGLYQYDYSNINSIKLLSFIAAKM